MDISIFRWFVHEYGNPKLNLIFDNEQSSRMSFNNLRTESILRGFGYTVSSTDNLSDQERHEILSDIVDLEILSVSYITHLISFFIQTHTQVKDIYAVDKWKSDMIYISNYKINPQRFFIAK